MNRSLLFCLLMVASFASSLTSQISAQALYQWQQCDTCYNDSTHVVDLSVTTAREQPTLLFPCISRCIAGSSGMTNNIHDRTTTAAKCSKPRTNGYKEEE